MIALRQTILLSQIVVLLAGRSIVPLAQGFCTTTSAYQPGCRRTATSGRGQLSMGLSSIFRPLMPGSGGKKKAPVSASTSAIPTQEGVNTVPRLNVRPRPVVSLDEKTGMYVRPFDDAKAPQSSSGFEQAQLRYILEQDDSALSGWGSFKDLIFDTFDSVTSIRSRFGRKQTTNSILDRKLAYSYSDTVEYKEQNPLLGSILDRDDSSVSVRESPGEKLMEQFESSVQSTNTDVSTGTDLYRSDTRKSFDDAKDAIYNLLDGGAQKKKENKQPFRGQTPAPAIEEITQSFKAAAKPSINKDKTVVNLTPYLADLHSQNPIKRLQARLAISTAERKRKRQIQRENLENAIDGVKLMIYDFADSIQVMYEVLLNLPKKVEETVEATQYAIEESVLQTKNTVKEVKALPSKVQQKIEDTKQSVENTKKATIEVVQEVQSIPSKVDRSIQDTKQSIRETKEGVEKFVVKVEDLTYGAKVLVGLEQPKPKPPPPPKTTSEIAMEVAGTVAKTAAVTTGKAAVIVGKGTVGMATSAVKIAINSAKEQAEKKKQETTAKQVLERTAVQPSAPVTTSIAEIDPLLEKEVAEALRSAEAALVEAESNKVKSTKNELLSIQINEAVVKAREAAAQARKDADDLEAMLKKKRKRTTLS
jgi:hypothetical protein